MDLHRWHLSKLQQFIYVEQLDHVSLSRVLTSRNTAHGVFRAEYVLAVASLRLAIAHNEPFDGFFSRIGAEDIALGPVYVDCTIARDALAGSLAITADRANGTTRPNVLHMILRSLVQFRLPFHGSQRFLLFQELDSFLICLRSFTRLQAFNLDIDHIDVMTLQSLLLELRLDLVR